MKIRLKNFGIEIEVLKERITLLHVGANFYETVGGSFIAHHDPNWEKVEEWEDITEQCKVSPTGFLTCDGEPLEYANSRFIKIDGLHNGPAFIIERRKS